MTTSKSYHLQFTITYWLGFIFFFCFVLFPSPIFVLQMGTNYKAALIPQRIRETIHGWGKSARRKRRLRIFTDDATIHTETSTVMSLEDDDNQHVDTPKAATGYAIIEMQPPTAANVSASVTNDASRAVRTPLLQPSLSLSLPVAQNFIDGAPLRSSSMPAQNFDAENSLRSSSMPR